MAALSLAGTAAYFSVYGLTKLFYAAGIGITILAASLEFAKLVTVSYVYRYWKNIKKGLRGFYVFAVVFIMLLTSIGIYGFLTGAYQQSANKIQLRDTHIQIAENKKKLFVDQLDRITKSIQSSNDRINTLSSVRSQQENRLDNLYNQKYVNVAKRTETQITGSDEQIKLLNSDITDKIRQTTSINDSIGFYDQKISELKNSDVSNEIGPYKFVADLTGMPVGKIVNIVAILIILVFDPLAVALLIGVNQLTLADSPLYTEKENEPPNFIDKFFKRKKKKNINKNDNDTDENTENNTNNTKDNQPENNENPTKPENNENNNFEPAYFEPAFIFKSIEHPQNNKIQIVETNEPIQTQTITEPVTEPITEPVTEPITEPVAEPIAEPIAEINAEANKSEQIIQPVEEKFAEFVINSEVDPSSDKPINNEPISENDEDNVKSFLDVFEKNSDDYQANKLPFTKGRVNVAHFVPKEE
jgi:hypothetical protein